VLLNTVGAAEAASGGDLVDMMIFSGVDEGVVGCSVIRLRDNYLNCEKSIERKINVEYL
jgi:hypothetical protein